MPHLSWNIDGDGSRYKFVSHDKDRFRSISRTTHIVERVLPVSVESMKRNDGCVLHGSLDEDDSDASS